MPKTKRTRPSRDAIAKSKKSLIAALEASHPDVHVQIVQGHIKTRMRQGRLQMLVCIDCKHGPDTCVRPDDGMYPVNACRQICDGPAKAGCECDHHNSPEWLEDLDEPSPLIGVDEIMLRMWGA